jgi:hypothetical protein
LLSNVIKLVDREFKDSLSEFTSLAMDSEFIALDETSKNECTYVDGAYTDCLCPKGPLLIRYLAL